MVDSYKLFVDDEEVLPVKEWPQPESSGCFTYTGPHAAVFKVGLLLRMDDGWGGFFHGRVTGVTYVTTDEVTVSFVEVSQ